METLNRGDKIYLDKDSTIESAINPYLDCRDGVVTCFEYNGGSGYGEKERLFLCHNYKHESICVVRQTWSTHKSQWLEESMHFEANDYEFFEALITGKTECFGGKYTLVRDY